MNASITAAIVSLANQISAARRCCTGPADGAAGRAAVGGSPLL